jgi:UDP-N-acetylglucosamine 4,6-dehydratase
MKLHGKRILIVGGTGSLGQALIRRESNENELIITSRDEAKHWTLRNRLPKNSNVEFVVADIRDSSRMENVIRNVNPEVIILAAALKQVDTCEKSPYESIQTNLLGISNVIDSVQRLERELDRLETVLMVSTDKACAPTNVYGMSKAISERLVTSSVSRSGNVKFVAVRYGNVLESRGSIIPLFRFQAQNGLNLSVTHEDMTRFIMTLDQSIDLIEDTILGAPSGEIWLPKLKSMNILDLARIFANRYEVEFNVSGMRPGEKLHEELVSEPESIRVFDSGKYLQMRPSLSSISAGTKIFNYSSKDFLMDINGLEEYLNELKIFDQSLDSFVGREIEEIALPRGNK